MPKCQMLTNIWLTKVQDLRVYGNGNFDTSNGSKGIVIWESSDLRNWSYPRFVTISPSNAGMTWAPDAIWDPSRGQYLVHWTCNLKGEGWFIMKSYTSDFKTFSTAQRYLTGAGMDATVVFDRSSNKYYRVSKNGPNELIEEASGTSLSGSWSVVRNQIGSGVIPKGEGPLIFQDNQNSAKVCPFFDSGAIPLSVSVPLADNDSGISSSITTLEAPATFHLRPLT